MASTKPQCGSEKEDAEYDLGLHVAGLFLVLGVSCIGCGFPVTAKNIKWMKIPPKVFFACKHFETGVLIATAFVHLLPLPPSKALATRASIIFSLRTTRQLLAS